MPFEYHPSWRPAADLYGLLSTRAFGRDDPSLLERLRLAGRLFYRPLLGVGAETVYRELDWVLASAVEREAG